MDLDKEDLYFLRIVADGLEKARKGKDTKDLINYFIRESKKATDDHYEHEEFFNGCHDAVKRFEDTIRGDYDKEKDTRKRRIEFLRGRLSQKHNDQLAKELAEVEKELAEMKPEDLVVSMISRPELQYPYNLHVSEVMRIKKAIMIASDENLTSDSSANDNSSRETRNLIIDLINDIDDKGWKYVFKNENDFTQFVDLLAKYFEGQPYELPSKKINLVRRCKTRFASVLKDIHKKLTIKPLSQDKEYLNIIRVLSPYANEKDLYKTLSR